MAITKRPAYVTRRKDQQRLARETERRAARMERKHSTGPEPEDPETEGPPAEDMETDADDED